MRYPSTSAALLFLLDPARRYVNFNQFAYPALQAQSIIEKATQAAVIQNTSAAQPLWSGSAINSTYTAVNIPGSYPGVAGLTFSGSQYMKYDNLSSSATGTETPLTVVCVASCGASGGTLWSFGDASTDVFSLSYSGGTLTLKEVNSSATFTAAATVTASTFHVFTAIRAANKIILRVDSVAGSPTSVTAEAEPFTTFTVGALNSGGSVSSQFNGVLGKVAVYAGAADIYQVETELLLATGVIQGASVNTNPGF
jgi:hypothetical protein